MDVMTKGNVGAIVCPMLEDELVFGIENDPEPKNIYIVEGEYNRTIMHKLDQRSIPYEIMDGYRLQSGLGTDPDAFNIIIIMNPLKLHKDPPKLLEFIKDQLTMLQGRFDAISLYYGMCGTNGWDPTAWAAEHISTPVTVFHDHDGEVCDDCISVAVGGRSQYKRLVLDYTGMLFLTPATATNWNAYPLSDTEEWDRFYETADDYMRDLFSWAGYKYALRIDTGLGDRETVDSRCQEVADNMGLRLIDPETPVATTDLATDIYSRTKALLDRARSEHDDIP